MWVCARVMRQCQIYRSPSTWIKLKVKKRNSFRKNVFIIKNKVTTYDQSDPEAFSVWRPERVFIPRIHQRCISLNLAKIELSGVHLANWDNYINGSDEHNNWSECKARSAAPVQAAYFGVILLVIVMFHPFDTFFISTFLKLC